MQESIRSHRGSRLTIVVLATVAIIIATLATGFAARGARQAAIAVMGGVQPGIQRAEPSLVRVAQDQQQPTVVGCYSIRKNPIGVSWCKPSELARRAGQDTQGAVDDLSARMDEQEQRLPGGVEIVCTGSTGPSATPPGASASPPSVEDDGSSVSVTATKPSATAPSVDRGDRACRPHTR